MKIPYPTVAEVAACDPHRDTYRLLRWRTFCPVPSNPAEEEAAQMIVDRLEVTNKEHRERIEKAVGFGVG